MPIPKRTRSTTNSSPSKATKKFSVRALTGEGEGEKVLLYAVSGMGKTTLAQQAPNPIFIALDDGARKIRHPKTGEPINAVGDDDNPVETFQDVRDTLHQPGLFPKGSTCVIDNVTVLQEWAERHMLKTIRTQKGHEAENIVAYGYNKGYTHLYDTMKLILSDLDSLVRGGVNIVLVAQRKPAKESNPGGTDYTCDGPNLCTRDPSVRALYTEWADHVLRIGYLNAFVEKANKDATKGKISGGSERAIYVVGEPWFIAKSRTIREPVVSFSEPGDDSTWRFVFPDAYPAPEQEVELWVEYRALWYLFYNLVLYGLPGLRHFFC